MRYIKYAVVQARTNVTAWTAGGRELLLFLCVDELCEGWHFWTTVYFNCCVFNIGTTERFVATKYDPQFGRKFIEAVKNGQSIGKISIRATISGFAAEGA